MCYGYIEALAFGLLKLMPQTFYEMTLDELFRLITARYNYQRLQNGKNPFVDTDMIKEDIELLKRIAEESNGKR